MPKVFESEGFKFFFFANEGNPREALHIHVRKAERIAKFWIYPQVSLEENYGFISKELKLIEKTIKNNVELIEAKWNDFFSSES